MLNEERQAETAADSSTQDETALSVRRHNTNALVGSSSFLEVVKEMDKYANQMWVDKTLWYISGGESNYGLMVQIKDDTATVAAQGWGSCQPLIAKTPDELRECIKCWWRHR